MKFNHHKERMITLKHLFINNQKMIGIKFYPDKVTQSLIKQLPRIKWSNKYAMAVIPNSSENLSSVFGLFKGVAWINCAYFYPNKPVRENNEPISVDSYRKRATSIHWRFCPEEFYQKLEIRKYSMNTARIYIAMFEKFINHFVHIDNLMEIDEYEIKKYLGKLVVDKKSDAYINQSINAIKFYYEVVKEMPNRFYAVERPIKAEKLPEVLAKSQVLQMINVNILEFI
ncbi:MAG: integrase/recombinase XerD [Cyclobacteriaceae bacterium]|jgi:hypothetical protein